MTGGVQGCGLRGDADGVCDAEGREEEEIGIRDQGSGVGGRGSGVGDQI